MFQSEVCAVLKMSKLSQTVVSPKPIERQRVSTCLQVFFCEETATALELNGGQHCIYVTGTVKFIRKVLKWWTINHECEEQGNGFTKTSTISAVISHPDDPRLQFLEELGEMCLNMSGRQGKQEHQLSVKTLLLLYPNMLWHSGTYQNLVSTIFN